MNLIDFFQQDNGEGREYRVQRLMAALRGHRTADDLSPVYRMDQDGKLTRTGEMSFIPGFEIVNLPLTEEDKQEIKQIIEGIKNG